MRIADLTIHDVAFGGKGVARDGGKAVFVPLCPYFGRCGGCSYQHVSYDHQLALKQKQVDQAMRRIARLNDPPMRPIVPSPLPYSYRNRITVHVEEGVVGFFRRDVHQLMDIVECPISMQ